VKLQHGVVTLRIRANQVLQPALAVAQAGRDFFRRKLHDIVEIIKPLFIITHGNPHQRF
jgi:hypothetical protein